MLIDFRERGRKIERGEKIYVKDNMDWLPSISVLTGDRNCTLGMCSDRKLNPQPFGIQDNAPTEPHQPGLFSPTFTIPLPSSIFLLSKNFSPPKNQNKVTSNFYVCYKTSILPPQEKKSLPSTPSNKRKNVNVFSNPNFNLYKRAILSSLCN